MDKLRKHWRLVAVTAFALFYLIFWLTARSILDEGVDIGEDGRKEAPADEIRDVDVSLVVENGSAQQTFSAKLTSNETIYDLLEVLRESGQLTHEQLEYTYGTVIVSINGQTAPIGYGWKVYDGSTEVTDFTRYKLSGDSIYLMRVQQL